MTSSYEVRVLIDVSTRLVLTGASGWFGRSALWEFEKLFGPESLRANVLPFASVAKPIDFGSPHGPVQALPLSELTQVENPAGLLHLAFLTRERVALEGLDAYIHKNRAITAAVAALLECHPTIPIITTSSGAAAALDGEAPDLARDPYATLKQEEERLWQLSAEQRMALVFRVYAASGRFLKDPSIFALGDFIRQAQAGQPVSIRSTRPVIRSYVHVGTLMRLAWTILLKPLPSGFRQLDAATHTLSLTELATIIADHWGLPAPQYNIDPNLPADLYAADPTAFIDLLSSYSIPSPSILEQILDTAQAHSINPTALRSSL